MRRLERSSGEAYAAALIAIGSVIIPSSWWFRCILLVVAAAVFSDLIWRSQLTVFWSRARKTTAIGLGVLLFGLGAWRAIVEDYRGPEKPDVTLRFTHPIAPMMALDNNSGVVARDVKWSFAVWNIDDFRTNVPGSSGDDPLPIPVGIFDFLRPHSSGGNQGVFHNALTSGLIKPGNRLVGSVSVTCPTCGRGYTYFLSIVWGDRGWYARSPDDRSDANLIVPSVIKKDNIIAYAAMIDQTPAEARRHIEAVKP